MLKYLLLLILFTPQIFAQELTTKLRVGDVILLPMNCGKPCEAIADETGTPFSHAGIILKGPTGELLVAEALGKVKLTGLRQFLSLGKKDQLAPVVRFYEFDELYQTQSRFKRFEKSIWQRFMVNFFGHRYDHQFLWNNYDENGKQKYYCTEMITKLVNLYLADEFPTFPMTYSKNLKFWKEYLKGQVPEGLPGNSPSDFSRSPLLKLVGQYRI